jgi:hypothetical protein
MNRTVSVIAVGGILTAAICLPLAALVHPAGPKPWWWESPTDDWFRDDAGGPIVSRDFSWDGGDRLQLSVPGVVHFHPAATWHLTVRGPEHTLDRLSVLDGHIRLNNSGFFHWGGNDRLAIELSGPALQGIAVNGSGSITLNDLKQDSLDIRIGGSGSAVAQGSVKSLRLDIRGSGRAELEGLAANDAYVRIGGSGLADIAPTDSADVSIGGSGEVRLHTFPRRLSSHVRGSGRVIEMSEGQLR